MKARFRYETPLLVNLNAESAVGATCDTGAEATYNCNPGSCPSESQCFNGAAAVACYSVGNSACHANNNSSCYGCCFSGSDVEGALRCACNVGPTAAWSCDVNGNAAGHNCNNGGNVSACW